MTQALAALHHRLAPAEELFFTWLLRVFGAATLAGCAWIDDAPPLDLAALLISAYVGLRVFTEFPAFLAVAPFRNQAMKIGWAVFSLLLLVLSFASVAIFVERLAQLVVG